MDIEESLLLGNRNFRSWSFSNDENIERFANLVHGQDPYAMIITCSDSRVIPEQIFSCGVGELFVIRTAGNVINEGELASIEYGIEHLYIKYILVLAHTHCGAVHAAIHNEKGSYLSPILTNIKRCIGNERNETQASITNAIKQVEYIKSKFPDYQGTVKAALYDIDFREVTVI